MTKKAVLMVNLGTPSEPTASAIRQYLKQFLSDKRVVELPAFLWKPILYGPVLTFRPSKLVPKYRSIWMDEGSPLMVYSERLKDLLEKEFQARQKDIGVFVGMRYGQPDCKERVKEIFKLGYERILVLPMYPQFSAGTTGTVIDRIGEALKEMRNQPEIRYVKRFYDHPAFIQATANKILSFWQENGKPEALLLSYHGLPQRYIDQGDPYYDDCLQTSELMKQALGEDVKIYSSFQSQFGRDKWIEPSTVEMMKQLREAGVKCLDVHSPCLVADCLETLEEIGQEYAHEFTQVLGGEAFRFIPCLNDDGLWAKGLCDLILQEIG
ncbi:ferrochelatase [Basilea psittacipulmonis]|uniref:ferrochelatase n=1 Tax=Basilea psittacipulmonis TaxID=1472345 RepID=UPI00068996E2|nr:ferrochelatase [Basilea psittacipulmonis]